METSFVCVARGFQHLEAVQLQMLLEGHGIETHLEGENFVAIDPILANAAGGIRVMVAVTDEAEAKEVLARDRSAREEAARRAAWTCPSCGSENTAPNPRAAGLLTLDYLTLGVSRLCVPWRKFCCQDCGQIW